MATLYKHDAYPQQRPAPMRAYHDVQLAYLKLKFPTASEAELSAFIKQTVGARLQRPVATVLTHPVYGRTEEKQIDLLSHIQKIGRNIITPSGSVYLPPDVKESPIRQTLTEKVAVRNKYKKVMLAAAEMGDVVGEANANYQQSSAKIFNNSLPGAHGSPFNVLYDLPGYNAVTSIARHSVMGGYSHVEKLIAGNLFLPSLTDTINYCLNHIRVLPANLAEVIQRYRLAIPDAETLAQHFLRSMRYYMILTPKIRADLLAFLVTLSAEQRCFVYYAGQLGTLLTANDTLFRDFFHDFFRTDHAVDETLDHGLIYKTEKDLLAMVTGLNYDEIDRTPLHKAVKNKHPGVLKLIAIARHMEAKIQAIGDLITCFFRVDADTAKVMEHPRMIRHCCPLSDTDSVMFSTKRMVEWYCGRLTFQRPGYEINAFTVYMVSRTLEHVFARISAGFGMVGEDIYKISMKNEFLYPVFLQTPIPKHYAALRAVQEGAILPSPKLEIKGVGFRSSKLSAVTNQEAERFTRWVIDETIRTDGQISGRDICGQVVRHEQIVYRSLMAGKKTFLSTEAVRLAGEYKDDPMRTIYFYYVMWQEVFEARFGNFPIPNKGLDIPILNKGNALRDPRWLKKLHEFDAALCERFTSFIDKHRDKDISRLILPASLPTVPEIFRPVMDARKIVYRNGQPFYLVLRALNIGQNFTKNDGYLASDFWPAGPEGVIPHYADLGSEAGDEVLDLAA